MKLGIHAYAWCSEWSNETLDLIDRVARMGLDFIEIPLMVLETFDGDAISKRLDSSGIDVCTSTVLLGETDITHPDPEIRRKGIDYLNRCVEATEQIGAENFSGVIYSQHVKQAEHRPTEQEWEWSAEALRQVARHAQDYGVRIGLEPVNRYESYLINTCEQAKKLQEMIGEKNVKIHLDTYHMNIEEKSFYEATRLAGKDLMHIHLCENDRGIPGTGLVDWEGMFKALGEMRYDGFAGLESFVDVTGNMNTWVWRQLAPSGDVLLREGVAFIKTMQKKYALD
ncbi:MAG TPA: sugar phosphate isomerase/epimerase family protein [bacterium]|nr:sugar phosphate isomerase/epimerase family protein [bacterium]